MGFGQLAEQYYVPALRTLEGIRVTGIADPLEAARNRARNAFPEAVVCSQAGEIIPRAPMNAVLVASPPTTHWPVWQLAREAAMPVFMEKPFPLPENLEEFEAISQTSVPLMVNFNRRFWPLYRELGERCRDGTIGDPRWARFQLHVNARRWSSVTNHRLDEKEGGALQDLGSQMVDLALATFEQDVQAVEISTKGPAQTRVKIRMLLAGGVDVECDVAYAARACERVEIQGSHGTLRILEPNMALRREPYDSWLHRIGAVAQDGWALAGHAWNRESSLLRYSIRLALQRFFETVRSGGGFEPGSRAALRTARVLAAGKPAVRAGVPR